MKEAKFWQEGMDGKRFALCLFRKIWVLAAVAVSSAAAAAGLYLLVTVALAGPPEYEVFSQYRIYFDDEKYGEIKDYYNAYTWGEIMKTDQVLDFVMEALPEGITREQVKESVSVGAMSDIKIMPLTITTQAAALSETIAEAYVYGLDRFGHSIEGLDGMDCWLVEPARRVERGTKAVNAAAAGLLLGALAAFLGMAVAYCLDDSFYLEEDFAQRYPYPVLGVILSGRKEVSEEKALEEKSSEEKSSEEKSSEEKSSGEKSPEVVSSEAVSSEDTDRGYPFIRNCFLAELRTNLRTAAGTGADGDGLAAGAADGNGNSRAAGKVLCMAEALPGLAEQWRTELEEAASEKLLDRTAYTWPFKEADVKAMRQSGGVVLLLPWGAGSGRMARHILLQLEKQQIPVRGAILCGAKERFLRAYYGRKAFEKRRPPAVSAKGTGKEESGVKAAQTDGGEE